jgi:hypothetical protein
MEIKNFIDLLKALQLTYICPSTPSLISTAFATFILRTSSASKTISKLPCPKIMTYIRHLLNEIQREDQGF